jgi:hypothetical protein
MASRHRPRHTTPQVPPPLAVSRPFSLAETLREMGGPSSSASTHRTTTTAPLSSAQGTATRHAEDLAKFLGPAVFELMLQHAPPDLVRDGVFVADRAEIAALPGGATLGNAISRPLAISCVPGSVSVPSTSSPSKVAVGGFLRMHDDTFVRALLQLPVCHVAVPVVQVRCFTVFVYPCSRAVRCLYQTLSLSGTTTLRRACSTCACRRYY